MIELRTLGEVDLRVCGRVPRAIVEHPKRFAIVTYLIAPDITVHRRETLLAMFWPELPEARARGALRKALHFIRRELGDDVLINHGDEAIAVDRSGIRCDASALKVAALSGDHEIVLRLHRGDFLAGFHLDNALEFDAWRELERARLADLALRSALSLTRELERAGRIDEAVDAISAARRLQPFNRKLARDAAELLRHAGHAPIAVRVYDEIARRLHEELGDTNAAILAYEESLKLRTELELQNRYERENIIGKLSLLRQLHSQV